MPAVSCSNRATIFRSLLSSVAVAAAAAAVVVVVVVDAVAVAAAARTVPPNDDEERPRCETWKVPAAANGDCCDGDGAATDDEA